VIDTVVVGAGPMGASAARHLSMDPAAGEVLVIGPDEPTEPHSGGGPFGAWHDEARLTRVIADDDVWATLAEESIDRYPQIAAEGGHPFHRPTGVIYVHQQADSHQRQLDVARRHRAVFREADTSEFPYLRAAADATVIVERGGAGTVNPRLLVQNQLVAAQRNGAIVLRDHVDGIEPAADGVRIRIAGGDPIQARRVVVAAGAYVHAFELLPEPLPVTSVGITALFFRVDGEVADVLADMPGILWHEDADQHWLYSVPPTRDPDGNLWFKIGGYRDSGPVRSRDEVDDWHRSDGGQREGEFLRHWVAERIPVLAGGEAHRVGCVITESSSGFPIIRDVAPHVVVATGCGGAAAKSCDEIGRLAAVLSARGEWSSTLDAALFAG